MKSKRVDPELAARKKLHKELAARPEVVDLIAEAKAEYQKALAGDGLRRAPARRRNAKAR